MRAILIDPFACTLQEIETTADYKVICPLLSHEAHPVDMFSVAPNEMLQQTSDTLYVDDEGLLHGPLRGFHLNGFRQILAGKGLIVGVDSEGNGVDVNIDLKRVWNSLTFYEFLGPMVCECSDPWEKPPVTT